MSSIVIGRRVFVALILAFALLAVYELSDQEPRSARTIPTPFLDSKFQGEDAATNAIRSESSVLTRIPVKNASDRQTAGRVGKIVQDYGSFVLVAKSRGTEAKVYGLEEQTVETTVHLPGASFDPLKQPPPGSLRLGAAATANGDGYYVLQFGGTATDEWLKSVSNAGVEILQYVPHQAYLVYGSSEAIARVAEHSRVRWIGQYTADQKLTPAFRKQLDAARNGKQLGRGLAPMELNKKRTAVFDVAVFARADLDPVASELRQNFAKGSFKTIRLQHSFFNVVRIEMSPDDIETVAAMPHVAGIEAVISAKNEDARSAHIIGGNYLNPTTLSITQYDPLTHFGVDGTNVTVSVVDDGVGIPGDGGFYVHSLNAVDGPLRGSSSGAFGHGHLNASIIAGSAEPAAPTDPGFFNYGIGVAPRANIINIPRNRFGYTGTDAEVYHDSVSTPGLNGIHATISNNSWGLGTNGNAYSFLVEGMFDGFVRDASLTPGVDPITLIFSAGNSGGDGLTRPKVAKNVIAVGNSESLRPELANADSNNMDDLASDSSRGPAADGRIKPDIVAPGVAITGGRSGTNGLKGNIDAFHRWSSGTSQAAAHVTGAAALFSGWYTARFGFRPNPSLIKAALINSAVNMNGQGSSAPVPNGSEGWGRPHLKTIFTPGTNVRYLNEEVGLEETGHGFPLNGSVADGSKPIRVTLAWTDPPGTADPALMNNLDLVVTVNGVQYKGNVFSNGISVPGGAADTRNNVECVFLPAGIPTGTPFFIEIRATPLNADGILNNGDATDQNYSLAAFNWSGLQSPGVHRIAGRVISANGRGIGSAKVRITNAQGVTVETQTSAFGYFAFPSIPGGQIYTVNITSQQYVFSQQTLLVAGDMTSLTFQAQPGSP